LIYSYYSDESKESLEDHINLALSLINDESKLVKHGSKFTKYFPIYAKLSVIFHDLGKVFFQKNYSRLGNYLSFRGHEFLSAYIFEKFRKQLLMLDPDNAEIYKEYKIITFAILYHHHAMGRELDDRYINLDSVKMGFNYFSELKGIVSSFLVKINMSEPGLRAFNNVLAEMQFSSNFLESVKTYIDRIKADLWGEFISDASFRKKSLLLLILLIAVDYLAAQSIRKPTSSVFSQTINDFYQLYMSL